MKGRRSRIANNNRKEEQSWKTHYSIPILTIKIQKSGQHILAKEETYRSMQQNRAQK